MFSLRRFLPVHPIIPQLTHAGEKPGTTKSQMKKKKIGFGSRYVKPRGSLQDSPSADCSKPFAHACWRLKNSCLFSQQSQVATCGELCEGRLALVGTPEGADGEVVAGTRAQGLQGVLAEGGLQAEGGLPPLPVRQPVLQQDGVHLGTWRRPLHKGHCVRDVPHQDLRWAIDDCGGGGQTGTCYFGRVGWGKVAALGDTKLQGCFNLTFRVSEVSSWGQGREVAWARVTTLCPKVLRGFDPGGFPVPCPNLPALS